MSAKNRKSKSKPLDVYPTPSWCVENFLRHGPELPGGQWLEPTAGDGAIIRAVNERRRGISWDAVEIREECADKLETLTDAFLVGDLLAPEIRLEDFEVNRWDVVITNPPFSRAQEVIEKVWDWADVVVMLLRLNFLGSVVRESFFDERGMPDVYVISPRPSFFKGEKSSSDACEYAWFVWRPGEQRRGEVRRLPPWQPKRIGRII